MALDTEMFKQENPYSSYSEVISNDLNHTEK